MRTDILCVTHAKDLEFCAAMVRSYEKFATGFGRLKIAIPCGDYELFKHELPNYSRYIHGSDSTYVEKEGKGMLHHEVQICQADCWLPEADQILHLDADCIFKQPVTPEFYMRNGKPVLLGELWEDFRESYPTRYGWRKCVQDALGFVGHFETMVRHPHLHVREVYLKTRQLVEKHHGRAFEEYVLSCENSFPQTFAEFPTLGTVALAFFPDKYELEVYRESDGQPDRGLVEFWSHGGLDHISDRQHGYSVDGWGRSSCGQTPRKVMADLGLL